MIKTNQNKPGMLMCMGELGDVIRAFRQRFRLSKAKSADVLGVARNTLTSLESGLDVSTGMPFTPRAATLRHIAAKMTEFGYPVTFQQLNEASESEADEVAAISVAQKIEIFQKDVISSGIEPIAEPLSVVLKELLIPFGYGKSGLTKIAKSLDCERGDLESWLAGSDVPSREMAIKLALNLKVSPDKILASSGYIAVPDVKPATNISPSEVALFAGQTIPIPYFGVVGCGRIIATSDHPDGSRDVPASYLAGLDPGDYGVVESAGDSMNQAKPRPIYPQMTMLVRRSTHAEDGDVVLADVPYQGTTCKRYRVRAEGHYLVAESSSEYPEIKLDGEIKIVGVVERAWLVAEF